MTKLPTEADVLQALRAVQDPDLHRDIVALGFVKNLGLEAGRVKFDIELTTPACPVKNLMRDQATAAVRALPGVTDVAVTMTARVRQAQAPNDAGLERVRNVIAVASGKGGVGKSTVATNLALALAREGARVGLLDADVYGPSVSMMVGELETAGGPGEGDMILPARAQGIKFVSMGLFTDADTPVIWRGPMASKLVQEFVGRVDWG
jgi:ATP-binding protein involved in chromosome partitioning